MKSSGEKNLIRIINVEIPGIAECKIWDFLSKDPPPGSLGQGAASLRSLEMLWGHRLPGEMLDKAK